jgi:hypothetical protein
VRRPVPTLVAPWSSSAGPIDLGCQLRSAGGQGRAGDGDQAEFWHQGCGRVTWAGMRSSGER